MKTCVRCFESKDESCFYVMKQSKTGLRPECKACTKAGVNKDRRREYERSYRDRNLEQRRKIVRESSARNKEHHKEVRRKYLQTEAGQSMYRKQTQKRYALRKAAYVEDVSPIDLFNDQAGVCYLCLKKFEFKEMELDHVMPISRGGKHEKSNCKMACAKCNRSKGSRTLEEMIYPLV